MNNEPARGNISCPYTKEPARMPPKCRVNKTFPAIQKGCKAVARKPKETVGNKRQRKEAAAPVAMHPNDTPLARLQRNATRNMQLIREEKEALRINKITEACLAGIQKANSKANAAATRQRIIGRIKGARERKTLPVH